MEESPWSERAVTYREVLVMVMRKHQRYFPVYSQDGKELLPYFITVANGPIHPPTVIAGPPYGLLCTAIGILFRMKDCQGRCLSFCWAK